LQSSDVLSTVRWSSLPLRLTKVWSNQGRSIKRLLIEAQSNAGSIRCFFLSLFYVIG
jgi:hypothetical protein